MKNLIIIGMPGAGKSTMGVILAKVLGRRFIDTDLVIQEKTGRLLQQILDEDGPEAFRKIEEETILSKTFHNAVIATGGSVVLSWKALRYLREDSVIVYLAISYDEMVKRLSNISSRGIVLEKGQSLRDMYNERAPLYERNADITIDCEGEFESCVGNVVERLRTLQASR